MFISVYGPIGIKVYLSAFGAHFPPFKSQNKHTFHEVVEDSPVPLFFSARLFHSSSTSGQDSLHCRRGRCQAAKVINWLRSLKHAVHLVNSWCQVLSPECNKQSAHICSSTTKVIYLKAFVFRKSHNLKVSFAQLPKVTLINRIHTYLINSG
jgi:hypothetical protein